MGTGRPPADLTEPLIPKPFDGSAASSRLQGKGRAGGHAENGRRPASLRDEGVDVLDLTVQRVWRRVATVAAAPPIIVKHREVRRQQLRQFRRPGVERPVLERPPDEDDRRSLTVPIERDAGPIH
jgi:hypothetical protein